MTSGHPQEAMGCWLRCNARAVLSREDRLVEASCTRDSVTRDLQPSPDCSFWMPRLRRARCRSVRVVGVGFWVGTPTILLCRTAESLVISCEAESPLKKAR